MIEIDKTKFVYIITLKKPELLDTVKSRLVEVGFEKNQIINEDARKFGQVGDYVAQTWFPDEPTQLFIHKIIKVETVSPSREGDSEINIISKGDKLLTIELFEKDLE